MKLKHLFLAQVVVSLINGASAVFAPKMWLSMYGMATITAETSAVGQVLGAGLLNYAIVAWFARNSPDSAARRAIVLGFLISHAIAFVIVTMAILSGVMGSAGWMASGLYLVIALAYTYFLFAKPGD
jgi:hypothetical protein